MTVNPTSQSARRHGDRLPTLPGRVGVTGERKLINAGWDRPGPQFLAAHAAAMQEAPFDGVVFNLWEVKPNHRVGNTWALFHYRDRPGFSLDDVDPEAFSGIQWTSFTDNLIAAHPCPYGTQSIDFFSDAEWERAAARVELLGAVLRASGARGIWFDPEQGTNGMRYRAEEFPGHSFDDVAAQARIRGQQFMQALQHEKPDVRVLFTFLSSVRFGAENDADPTSTRYALLPHFVAGMFEAKGDQVVIIDGAENDYYHDDSQRFVRSRQYLTSAWYTFPDSVHEAVVAGLHIGSAVYADAVMGLAVEGRWVADRFEYYEEIRHDPEFHRQWMKNNVYHALLTSDDYVWLWNERMSWWNPEALPLPDGVDEAIREARELFNAGSRLGFDMCRSDRAETPTFVSSPVVELTIAERGTTGTGVGDTVVLQSTPQRATGAPDIDHVTLYHNDRVVGEFHVMPWRVPAILGPGVHTFHAVGFNADGTHCASNPLVLVAE